MRTLIASLIVGVACAVAGCGPQQPQTREWTEDVLLSPGRIIQVKRTVAFDETNSLSRDAYNAVEREATISFTGDLAHLPTWRAPLRAMALYHDNMTNDWVIVAVTSSCTWWRERGKPKPPYFEFRSPGSEWREVPLSQASIGRSSNLLRLYPKNRIHVTVDDRLRLQAGGRSARLYREIVGDLDVYFCGEGDPNK